MLNDIYSTSMAGRYETRRDGKTIESGSWSYQGYGNAEIAMHAEGQRAGEAIRYDIHLHSAERQIDEIACRTRSTDDGQGVLLDFRAIVAGRNMEMRLREGDGEMSEGSVDIPNEAVFDGTSPIWLIHLMLTAPPPVDRQIVTPFIAVEAGSRGFRTGFFKVSRSGQTVHFDVLDDQGEERDTIDILLSEDGCPRSIRRGDAETMVVRTPHILTSVDPAR